jgi:hypothetical protein
MLQIALVVAVACAAGLGGCASVTRGWNEQVQFDSEPSGAEMRSVVLNACDAACAAESARASGRDVSSYSAVEPEPPKPGPACITPCNLQVPRRDVLLVTFTKPGFAPQTVKVDTQMAAAGGLALAGNLIIGGAVGTVIDAGSGATLEHVPNPVKVVLKPAPATAPKPSPQRRTRPPTS